MDRSSIGWKNSLNFMNSSVKKEMTNEITACGWDMC
jgi:hypothetical protein